MLILIDILVQILYTTADKISLKYLGSVSYLDLRFTAGQIKQKKVLNFVTQAPKVIDLPNGNYLTLFHFRIFCNKFYKPVAKYVSVMFFRINQIREE